MKHLKSKIPRIRPYNPAKDEHALAIAAASDNGAVVIAPTHVIEKDGEVVGYLGINSLPLVLFWMHSKKVTPRDSLFAVATYENLLAAGGAKFACVPVHEDSPFFKHTKDWGMVYCGAHHLFVKPLV